MKVYKNKMIRMSRFLEALRKDLYPNGKIFSNKLKKSDELNDESLYVSAKTIQREIHFLKEHFKAPIHYDSSAKGFYLTDSSWQLPINALDEEELFANLFSMKLSQDRMPEPLLPTLNDLEDIQFAAISGNQFTVDSLNSLIVKGEQYLEIDIEIFRVILNAWQGSQTLKVTYNSAANNKSSKREIDIHALVLANNTWYAHSFCHERQAFRSFALHRILTAILVDEHFTKDEKLISQLKNNHPFSYEMVEDVEVHVSAKLASTLAERQQFPEQVFQLLADGSARLTYPEAPLEALVAWVLSHGGELQLLAPPRAVELFREKIANFNQILEVQMEKR